MSNSNSNSKSHNLKETQGYEGQMVEWNTFSLSFNLSNSKLDNAEYEVLNVNVVDSRFNQDINMIIFILHKKGKTDEDAC